MSDLVHTSTVSDWPTIQAMVDALSAGDIVTFVGLVALTLTLIVKRLEVLSVVTGTAGRVLEFVLALIERVVRSRWK